MSRHNYTDEWGNSMYLYRGTVKRSINGKRGQVFLKRLLEALEALPEKELIPFELEKETGQCCALGSVLKHESIKLKGLDSTKEIEKYWDSEILAFELGKALNISYQMASEIMFLNDDRWDGIKTKERWKRIYDWATENLKDK